jgi:GntR family transcriptional regulator
VFTIAIDTRDPTPIYAQVERGLRAAIAVGRLQPGEQLPTVRQLAVEVSVNANTIARVYAELERQGVLETRRGVGTFVAATAPRPMPARERRRQLATFLTRILAEATGAGFTVDEVLDGLQARRAGGDE